MSDQSRLFLAAILMLGVLLVSWFVTGKTGQATDEVNQTIAVPPESLFVPPTEEILPLDTIQLSLSDSIPNTDELINETCFEETIVTVIIPSEEPGDTLVVASLSNKGGSVTSWSLTNYTDFPSEDINQNVNLVQEPWFVSGNHEGEIPFSYSGPDTVVVSELGTDVVFQFGDAVKTYSFSRGFYSFTVQKINLDEETTIPAATLPVTEVLASDKGYFTSSWFTNSHNKEKSESIEALESVGNVTWISTSSKYFTIILMPESTERAAAFVAPGEGGSPRITLNETSISVFAGPKSYHLLGQLGRSTQDMIDFGWPVIRWIAKLIFYYLTVALSFIPNWGLRIIVLAITLKALLSPLTTKSYVSMQKMQKIQPAMKQIQEKYAKDPKQQQVEMQKLYKEKGVNPIGGCLPMLLQMPVFFAMYRVLANMVELRGASFMFWINDLSRPELLVHFNTKVFGLEGIGLMAVLLGIIMFLQQKLTGSSATGAAAQQQKMMMYMMPIFMTFLFMRFASGLTLYWLVFNILTLIHQEFIKKNLATE